MWAVEVPPSRVPHHTLPPPREPLPSRVLLDQLFTLLQKCNSAAKLSQIHAQILANGFSQKGFLIGKLVSLYAVFGCSRLAQRALDGFHSSSTTTLLWNLMIRLSLSPLEIYNRMRQNGCDPDGHSYSYVLSRCLRSRLWKEGQQIHGRVICDGFCSNVVVGTGLVNFYASVAVGDGSGDGIVDVRKVFEEMSDRNVVAWNSLLAAHIKCRDVEGAMRVFDSIPDRTVVSWTTLIVGCTQNGRCKLAVSFFNQMLKTPVEVDHVALTAALSACAELGDLNLGRQIHSYAHRSFQRRQRLPVSLQNSLMHMYSSCGALEDAYGVFTEILIKSKVSWTTMIIGYAKHGFADEALKLFQQMQMECLRSEGGQDWPDAITFIGVLCACTHAGYVQMGQRYFDEMMDKWGIEPRIEHYGCMVDLLSRAGLLDEALRLVESMPMRPNEAIWGALLAGCKIHKNVELASLATESLKVFELDPNRAMGYLVLLSNVYAADRKWEEVAAVRQGMVQIGGLKPQGRSWVQVDGTIHDFMAGDCTHKDALSVCQTVDCISRQVLMKHSSELDIDDSIGEY